VRTTLESVKDMSKSSSSSSVKRVSETQIPPAVVRLYFPLECFLNWYKAHSSRFKGTRLQSALGGASGRTMGRVLFQYPFWAVIYLILCWKRHRLQIG
jgi:hypothetical protein